MIDLRPQLPTVRDQGARPTCLAHSMTDAHSAARGASQPLAVDPLHYEAARLLGLGPNEGVTFKVTSSALANSGQPLEEFCPYSQSPLPAAWLPPTGPTYHKESASTGLGSAATVEVAIKGGDPIIVVVNLSDSFFEKLPASGTIPEDNSNRPDNHAVVVVGLDSGGPNQRFLVRNSWGLGWGIDGHAWLESSYIDKRALFTISLH